MKRSLRSQVGHELIDDCACMTWPAFSQPLTNACSIACYACTCDDRACMQLAYAAVATGDHEDEELAVEAFPALYDGETDASRRHRLRAYQETWRSLRGRLEA
jgi:hypothetical protein